MLKAYIDDSGVGQHPVYVLAGFVASAREWAPFSDAWDRVLWMSPRIRYFKMSEAMGLNGEFLGISPERRDEKLRLLVNAIECHRLYGVSIAIPHFIFENLFKGRLTKPMNSPYFYAFYGIIGHIFMILSGRGVTDRLDLYFDKQVEHADKILPAWDHFVELAPQHIRGMIGNPPNFLDDKDFVALQAADLHAWWTRHQYEAQSRGAPDPVPPWGDGGKKIETAGFLWTPEFAEGLHEKLFGARPVRVTWTFEYPWGPKFS
ncbi:MAG: DUF3800 domain-containing protein [Xanthobacteraceae bacterium]